MHWVNPQLAANRAVSLPELLASRELRQQRQQQWLECYSGALVVFTLVVPGAVKDSFLTRQIFNLGWQALQQKISMLQWRCLQQAIFPLPTGCEGWAALDKPALEVKKAVIQLESYNPVGRLWDMDVLDNKGKILSRRQFSQEERKCLLCSQPARLCARKRNHSIEALLSAMESLMINAFRAD